VFELPEGPEFVFQEEAAAKRRSVGENLQFYTGVGYLGGKSGALGQQQWPVLGAGPHTGAQSGSSSPQARLHWGLPMTAVMHCCACCSVKRKLLLQLTLIPVLLLLLLLLLPVCVLLRSEHRRRDRVCHRRLPLHKHAHGAGVQHAQVESQPAAQHVRCASSVQRAAPAAVDMGCT
jgi:hypothetical protein